jgi:uncharacterized protein
MSLFDQLSKDMIQAMKAKDAVKVSTLRMIRSTLKNICIEKKVDSLPDNAVITSLQKQAKSHQDSIEQFKKGSRADLVEKEQAELKIVQKYLPAQLDRDKLTQIVKEVIQELGAQGKQSTGPVMKAVMKKVQGSADGRLVSQIVSTELG